MSPIDTSNHFLTGEFGLANSPANTSTLSSSASNATSPPYHDIGSNYRAHAYPGVTRTSHETSSNETPDAHDADAPSLVTYLQQMHGLAKKRTHQGARTTKRSSRSMDETRPPQSHTRPILPRLSLGSSTASNPYPRPPAVQHRSVEMERPAHHVSASQSHPLARPDERRARRGSWLATRPLDAQPTRSPTIQAATHARHVAGAPRSFSTSVLPRIADTSNYTPYPNTSPLITRSSVGSVNAPHVSSSPPLDYSSAQHYLTNDSMNMPSPYNQTWVQVESPVHAYSPSFSASPSNQSFSSQSSTPLPSPSLTAQPISTLPIPNDPDNQPFIITPEYEAMANAQFEEVVRATGMQASLRRVETQVSTATLNSSRSRSRGESPAGTLAYGDGYSLVHPQYYPQVDQSVSSAESTPPQWWSGPPPGSF